MLRQCPDLGGYAAEPVCKKPPERKENTVIEIRLGRFEMLQLLEVENIANGHRLCDDVCYTPAAVEQRKFAKCDAGPKGGEPRAPLAIIEKNVNGGVARGQHIEPVGGISFPDDAIAGFVGTFFNVGLQPTDFLGG